MRQRGTFYSWKNLTDQMPLYVMVIRKIVIVIVQPVKGNFAIHKNIIILNFQLVKSNWQLVK